jgi:pimeloyl-[acyl-carrier protein] methyl ester esterase
VVEDMSPRIVNEAGWALGMRGGYDLRASEESVRMMRADWPAYAGSLARYMFADETASEALAAMAQREFAAQSPEPLASLWRDLAARDDRGLLPQIQTRTLVVEGRHGPYPAETARFIAAAMPHARQVEFARSGHAPHLEEPELFNRTIADFARRPAQPGTGRAVCATET